MTLAVAAAVLGWGRVSLASATDDTRPFLETMVRNLGMIEVDCPFDVEPAPENGLRICLGPYWAWKDFRRIWDDTAVDPRRVPSVPSPLSGWDANADSYARSYRLGKCTVSVVFDRKRQSVVLTSRPEPVAPEPPPAPIPTPAPSVAVAGPAAVAAAEVAALENATPAPPPSEGAAPSQTGIELAPVLIDTSRVAPRYPAAARSLHLKAQVVLNVVVGPDSKIEGVMVEFCSQPGKGFEDAAVSAVSKWKFRAGRLDGEPRRAQTRVVVTFTP